MIAIANNFHPKTGIGKYAFGLLQTFQKMRKPAEMLYFETKNDKIAATEGVRKINQSVGFPVANRTLSAYYTFPRKAPKGYSIYHASSQYLARIAKFRSPCVITHHDIAPIVFPSEYPLVMRFFVKKMLSAYSKAAKIIAISESSKRDLMKHVNVPEEKIHVIHHGVDNKLYRPMEKHYARDMLGLPREKKIVLHVGSEEPRKNISLLMASQRIVQERLGDDVLLVRVGNSVPRYESLRSKIRVKYFSGVPEAEMPLFYNSADVFVFPSIYEGFGLPVIEAMACGIPVIISKSLDTFRGGALMLESYDRTELSNAMLELLTSQLKSRRYSRKSLECSRKFNIENEAKQTWDLYQRLLQTPR